MKGSSATACARTCASSTKAPTRGVRKRLRSDGVEEALQSTTKLQDGEDENDEGAQRRIQAASHALDALHGKLDVHVSKHSSSNRPLTRQLSSVGTDYAKWSEQQLLDVPRYNTFISHKRSSAQDFARGLHSLIVHSGYSCFIDVENLESLSDLPMVVAGCDVFIFVRAPTTYPSTTPAQQGALIVWGGTGSLG